uniref:Uncharacterized protein n=1 Tax=Cacopsylla melanoneura TaxID=428564 RepID=A0A8D9EUK1_9HEMI
MLKMASIIHWFVSTYTSPLGFEILKERKKPPRIFRSNFDHVTVHIDIKNPTIGFRSHFPLLKTAVSRLSYYVGIYNNKIVILFEPVLCFRHYDTRLGYR